MRAPPTAAWKGVTGPPDREEHPAKLQIYGELMLHASAFEASSLLSRPFYSFQPLSLLGLGSEHEHQQGLSYVGGTWCRIEINWFLRCIFLGQLLDFELLATYLLFKGCGIRIRKVYVACSRTILATFDSNAAAVLLLSLYLDIYQLSNFCASASNDWVWSSLNSDASSISNSFSTRMWATCCLRIKYACTANLHMPLHQLHQVCGETTKTTVKKTKTLLRERVYAVQLFLLASSLFYAFFRHFPSPHHQPPRHRTTTTAAAVLLCWKMKLL